MLTFKAETNAKERKGKEILWVIVLTSTKIVSFSLMVEFLLAFKCFSGE